MTEIDNLKTIETTLLLLIKNDYIMLAKKKRGFGEGKYNGVGGKIKDGETPEKAMIRETREEVDVVPINHEKVGVIDFIEYINEERVNLRFHLYIASEWAGELKETEEMEPHWFSIDNIPYDQMWEDDKQWMPHALSGNKFDAYFEFAKDGNIINNKIIFNEEHSFGSKK